jgi:hypothetical protein
MISLPFANEMAHRGCTVVVPAHKKTSLFKKQGQEGAVDAGEGAAAEPDGTDCTDSLIVGEEDVGAGRFFVDGHFRHDGNAHASGDHADKAAELATFEHDLGMKARAVAGGESVFAETVAVAKEEEGFGAKILQRKIAVASEWVRFGNGGEERFGKNGEGFKFVAADGQSQQREINGGGAEAFKKHRSDFLHDGNVRLRKFAREVGQVRRKKIGSNGGNDADGDGATHGIFLVSQVAASCFEFAQHGTGARQECLANFGEAHGAAEAIEEASAEFVFKLADLLRERGLGDVGLASSTAEAAGIDDGAEVAKLVEFHGKF